MLSELSNRERALQAGCARSEALELHSDLLLARGFLFVLADKETRLDRSLLLSETQWREWMGRRTCDCGLQSFHSLSRDEAGRTDLKMLSTLRRRATTRRERPPPEYPNERKEKEKRRKLDSRTAPQISAYNVADCYRDGEPGSDPKRQQRRSGKPGKIGRKTRSQTTTPGEAT